MKSILVFTLVLSTLASTYFITGAVAIRYFIDDLVFKQVEERKTQEDMRFSYSMGTDEVLIRAYVPNFGLKKMAGQACVIFFPGRSGGIPRYESEIFEGLIKRNVPVYAISYPGYEGAKGTSSFTHIIDGLAGAINLISQNGYCNVKESVFVGRSLGASLAIEVAKFYKPKGLVFDSVGLSLVSVIESTLQKSTLLQPLNYLPIGYLIPVDHVITDDLRELVELEVIIYQGENDTMQPYDSLYQYFVDVDNVRVVAVPGANHSNTYKVAMGQYLDSIVSFLKPKIVNEKKSS